MNLLLESRALRGGSKRYLRYWAGFFKGAQNFGNSVRYIYSKMKKFKK